MQRGHEFRRSQEAQQTSQREVGTSSRAGSDGEGKWVYNAELEERMLLKERYGKSWDSTPQQKRISELSRDDRRQLFIEGINHSSDALTRPARENFINSLSQEEQLQVANYSMNINENLGYMHQHHATNIHYKTVLAWVHHNMGNYTTSVKDYNQNSNNDQLKEAIFTALRTTRSQLRDFTRMPNELPNAVAIYQEQKLTDSQRTSQTRGAKNTKLIKDSLHRAGQ